MLLAILGAGEAVFPQTLGIQRAFAADDDRDGNHAAGARRLFAGCRGERGFLASRQHNALLGRESRGFRRHGGDSPNREIYAHPIVFRYAFPRKLRVNTIAAPAL